VRLQLSALTGQVPNIAGVPPITTYLGQYIDHRLD
jgi:hypothetical protein